jgi:hypothetical protein
MSILERIKDQISRIGQRALGIDAVRFNQQVTLETLERLNHDQNKLSVLIQSKFAELGSQTTRTSDQLQNLRSFLTWYSNRVEPWFWTGNFSLSDPEEELAGLLFNFLPGRFLIQLGPPDKFSKAAAELGFQVLSVNPPDTIASPQVSETLPEQIDFLDIAGEQFSLEIIKAFDSTRPSVIKAGFVGENLSSKRPDNHPASEVSVGDLITEWRKREYYWNVIIFRTAPDDFIRMGTNLAGVPREAWGSILFFRDYQLFLKAFHWCKTTLPRFRAARLAG